MNKTLPTTIDAFSIYAAEQYLQTAVVIDDKIYSTREGTIAEPTLKKPLPSRKLALKSVATPLPTLSKPSEDGVEAEEPSFHDILSSFAKKHIVCALYQPRKTRSSGFNSEVYQLCVASDIVIIDWDLGGDIGAKAKELITHLIEQSIKDIPEQLRLILVYTSAQNLQAIANEVYEALNMVVPGNIEPQLEDKGLALHSPNTRVVILGKPGRRLEEYDNYQVTERDLADRAVVEFAKLAAGLLQGAVLLGLSKIRSNSRKILTKFDSSLDPAFLTHRALSLPDEEAFEHVLPLLVAEIQAILEDCLPNPMISEELIGDWCNKHWKPGAHTTVAGNAANVRAIAKEFCRQGLSIKDKYKSINKKSLVNFILPAVDSKENYGLAVLMSQRTYYDQKTRDLSLGTIVRFGTVANSKYLICLQPVCDSVRIDKTRSFIFCELETVDIMAGKTNITHIVIEETGIVALRFDPKSFRCAVIDFKPDVKEKRVVAKQVSNRVFCFTSASKKKYIWITQLKTDHAQRAVEQFASQLSRVGLTESEWLRLLGK